MLDDTWMRSDPNDRWYFRACDVRNVEKPCRGYVTRVDTTNLADLSVVDGVVEMAVSTLTPLGAELAAAWLPVRGGVDVIMEIGVRLASRVLSEGVPPTTTWTWGAGFFVDGDDWYGLAVSNTDEAASERAYAVHGIAPGLFVDTSSYPKLPLSRIRSTLVRAKRIGVDAMIYASLDGGLSWTAAVPAGVAPFTAPDGYFEVAATADAYLHVFGIFASDLYSGTNLWVRLYGVKYLDPSTPFPE